MARLTNNGDSTAAWNNVQEELTACTAFWHFAKTYAPENASEDERKRVDHIIMQFTDLALSVGSNIGMTQDAMLSRFKMAVENQARITEGKCINYASLALRYLTRCTSIAENPQGAFREYGKVATVPPGSKRGPPLPIGNATRFFPIPAN